MQLDFEVKLRSYKNYCDYNAPRPWVFPPVRDFSPRSQWEKKKADTELLNAEFKVPFSDKFEEKNANMLMH